MSGTGIVLKYVEPQAMRLMLFEGFPGYELEKFSAKTLIGLRDGDALQFQGLVLRSKTQENREASDGASLTFRHDVGGVGIGKHFVVLIFRPGTDKPAEVREVFDSSDLRDVTRNSGAKIHVGQYSSLGKSVNGQTGMGRRRDELAPGVQSFPFGRYIVFYRVVSDAIEVVRVLHGARDIETIF